MTCRVAVTAASSRAGLAAIRDLGRGGFSVLGAGFRRMPFGLRSRWSEAYLELPQPPEIDALLDILRAARLDAFLPMESPLVGFVSRHRDRIGRDIAVLVPSYDSFLAAYDNKRTLEECVRLGIPAPRILSSRDIDDTVVVKPREDVGAARGVAYCRTVEELERAIASCRRFGEPLVQECIPGDAGAMRTVVLLFDRDSRLAAYFTMRKLQQYPATGGLTTQAVSTDERGLVDLVLPFFESWGWRGPAEVELKIDARDGQPKVIEINPRFPAYLPFTVQCGLHMPRLAACAALGQPVRPATYAAGRRFLNPGLHIRAALASAQGRRRRTAALGRALAEACRTRWIDPEDLLDPAPRLGKILIELLDPRRSSELAG